MALEAVVSGQAALRRLAAQIEAEGNKGLGREMSAALRKVSKPLQAEITGEYEQGLPKAGGYVNTFTKSMRWRTTLRGGARSASFRLLLFGDGAHERRDVKALEEGRLRHPVYGRSRRVRRGVRRGTRDKNPWAVTSIKGGYFERGTDKAADQVEDKMMDVLTDFAGRLIK